MRINNASEQSLNRVYFIIVAHGVSLVGSAFTSFGLYVYVYEITGSYSSYASLALITYLPAIFLSPLAGVLIDQASKKSVLLLSGLIGLIAIATCLFVHTYFSLNIYVVGFVALSLAIANTLQWPALGVVVTGFCENESSIKKANGVLEAFKSFGLIMGPLIGATLYQQVGLENMLLIDVVSYLLAIFIILMTVFPFDVSPSSANKKAISDRTGIFDQVQVGFRWIFVNKGLLRLLGFFAAINICISVHVVSTYPYLLNFLTVEQLSRALIFGGAGSILGSLSFTRWIRNYGNERNIFFCALFLAILICIWGLAREPYAIYFVSMCEGFLLPVINASSQTIWQTHVPYAMQGRVFSVRKMLAWAVNPISIFVSIPLATHFFTPIANDIAVFGEGEVGGLGLMNSVLGVSIFFVTCLLIIRGGFELHKADLSQSKMS